MGIVTELGTDLNFLITKGFQCILHHLSGTFECEFTKIMGEYDKETGELKKRKVKFATGKMAILCQICVKDKMVAREFRLNQYLGRFILRQQDQTIGVGKVMKIVRKD